MSVLSDAESLVKAFAETVDALQKEFDDCRAELARIKLACGEGHTNRALGELARKQGVMSRLIMKAKPDIARVHRELHELTERDTQRPPSSSDAPVTPRRPPSRQDMEAAFEAAEQFGELRKSETPTVPVPKK